MNVTSVGAYRAIPEVPVYCMAKAAVQMFTDTLALGE